MGLEKVADAIYRLLQREGRRQRQAGASIREETIEAVLGDGWYRIGGDRLAAKGSAVLRVGQRVHVLWQQARRVLILTHHWKRAQPFGSVPGGGVAVVEELILGTIDGTSAMAPFGGDGDVIPDSTNGQNVDLWFRNKDQVTALGITDVLVAAGFDWINSNATEQQTRLIWGERDDTFALLVNDAAVSAEWTALVYKLNRDAGKVYGSSDMASVTLLRSEAVPHITLSAGGADYPSDSPVAHLLLTADLRLLGTTFEVVVVGPNLQYTMYVVDLDAGLELWAFPVPTINYAVNRETVSLMRWGATDAERWLVYSAGTTGATPTAQVAVVTLAGVELFADTISTIAPQQATARQLHHNDRWLLYTKQATTNVGAGPNEIHVDATYYLVRPDVGGPLVIGALTDFLLVNLPGVPDHSSVIARAWGLLPLRGDVFFVNADPIAEPDVEQGDEAGWLDLSNFSLATQNLLQRGIWPGPEQRGRLLTAASVTSLAGSFTFARPDPELAEYPAGYFKPFPLDANQTVSGFTAYHLVNDPAALGDLAAAAAL